MNRTVQQLLQETASGVGELSFTISEVRAKIETAEQSIDQLTSQLAAFRNDLLALERRQTRERAKLEVLQTLAEQLREEGASNGVANKADFEAILAGQEGE